jgi:hypothetical protein
MKVKHARLKGKELTLSSVQARRSPLRPAASAAHRCSSLPAHPRGPTQLPTAPLLAQTLLANSRATVEEAYPGDVIGVANPAGTFAIGDTIYTGSKRISYSKIPSFSPEVLFPHLAPAPRPRTSPPHM